MCIKMYTCNLKNIDFNKTLTKFNLKSKLKSNYESLINK